MPFHKARELRQPVTLGARLRHGAGWNDVVIRDISLRGLMAACAEPPGRGQYVELRCGEQVIVARVVWSRPDRFGARAQDRIDLEGLSGRAGRRPKRNGERRAHPRAPDLAPRMLDVVEQAAASSRTARLVQFLSISLVGTALVLLLAGVAREALAPPLSEVADTLAAERQAPSPLN